MTRTKLLLASGTTLLMTTPVLAQVSSLDDPRFALAYSQADTARDVCRRNEYQACYDLALPLAQSGNPVAQNLMGDLLANPGSPFYDAQSGITWYWRSGAQGFDRAWQNVGDFFEEDHPGLAPNYPLAVAGFQAGVDLGYEASFENLAWHLMLGDDSVQDYERALDVIRQTNRVHPDNTYVYSLLGDSYSYGLGQDVDLPAALDAYERAASADFAYAQVSAGYMYFVGSGTSVNEARAVELFELAAAQDYSDAFGYLAEAHYYGKSVPIDYGRALDYAERGDALGDSYATFYVGYIHLFGSGVPVNFDIATDAFERAVERGSGNALYQLGDMAYEGYGRDVDLTVARAQFRETVEVMPSHRYGNYSLGYMLLRGEGGAQDFAGAETYLLQAKSRGVEEAVAELAVLYGHPGFTNPNSNPVLGMAYCINSITLGQLADGENYDETIAACEHLEETLTTEQLLAAFDLSGSVWP